MKQRASHRLKTVLKLAQLRERQAASRLAESVRNTKLNSQQGQQLQQYKNEYCEQFKALENTQASAADLANYQRFYGNLQGAGETQQERLALAISQEEQARLQWQQQYARQKNMQSLIERKAKLEQRDVDNKLQRQQDDSRRVKQGELSGSLD